MGGDLVRAEAPRRDPLGELPRDPLGHAARVHEDQRRPMRLDQLDQAVVDLFPDLARHDGFERRQRYLEGEIPHAAVASIDDGAGYGGLALGVGADQEMRHRLDRLLGGREADPQQSITAKRRQPLERDRQVRAALVGGDRVDLVDDHGPRCPQHRPARLGAQEDVERLGRGHHDVRRPAPRAVALTLRRVAGPDPGPDLDLGQVELAQALADAGEGRLKITLDVVRESLER
jgi:hypothetical protein